MADCKEKSVPQKSLYIDYSHVPEDATSFTTCY